jgi:hypothetical protein
MCVCVCVCRSPSLRLQASRQAGTHRHEGSAQPVQHHDPKTHAPALILDQLILRGDLDEDGAGRVQGRVVGVGRPRRLGRRLRPSGQEEGDRELHPSWLCVCLWQGVVLLSRYWVGSQWWY